MRLPRLVLSALIALTFSVALAERAHATPIALVNGDFQTGTLAGWTTFTTANGNLGPTPLPDVQPFDVDGDTVATSAARFQVGQVTFVFNDQQGGGIFQSFASGVGNLTIDLDIASFDPQGFPDNVSGGVFSLLLDGITQATFDFGDIDQGTVERSTLHAVVPVVAGNHEIRILMTRPFLSAAPIQFVDDVTLDLAAAVPEPASLTLVGLGLAGLVARRNRRA